MILLKFLLLAMEIGLQVIMIVQVAEKAEAYLPEILGVSLKYHHWTLFAVFFFFLCTCNNVSHVFFLYFFLFFFFFFLLYATIFFPFICICSNLHLYMQQCVFLLFLFFLLYMQQCVFLLFPVFLFLCICINVFLLLFYLFLAVYVYAAMYVFSSSMYATMCSYCRFICSFLPLYMGQCVFFAIVFIPLYMQQFVFSVFFLSLCIVLLLVYTQKDMQCQFARDLSSQLPIFFPCIRSFAYGWFLSSCSFQNFRLLPSVQFAQPLLGIGD